MSSEWRKSWELKYSLGTSLKLTNVSCLPCLTLALGKGDNFKALRCSQTSRVSILLLYYEGHHTCPLQAVPHYCEVCKARKCCLAHVIDELVGLWFWSDFQQRTTGSTALRLSPRAFFGNEVRIFWNKWHSNRLYSTALCEDKTCGKRLLSVCACVSVFVCFLKFLMLQVLHKSVRMVFLMMQKSWKMWCSCGFFFKALSCVP